MGEENKIISAKEDVEILDVEEQTSFDKNDDFLKTSQSDENIEVNIETEENNNEGDVE